MSNEKKKETLNIYQKIQEAKMIIKSDPEKKKGRNSFSKYDYFTPEQVESLVMKACQKVGLLTMFHLLRTDLGLIGKLTIIDINSESSFDISIATEIPSIKATNVAQQLGGAVTYTERYLKMSAFGISENSLDFDTTESTKTNADSKKETSQAYTKPPVSINPPPRHKNEPSKASPITKQASPPVSKPTEQEQVTSDMAGELKATVANPENKNKATERQINIVKKIMKSTNLSNAIKQEFNDKLVKGLLTFKDADYVMNVLGKRAKQVKKIVEEAIKLKVCDDAGAEKLRSGLTKLVQEDIDSVNDLTHAKLVELVTLVVE